YRGGGPVHEKFTLPVRQNLNFSARKGYNKNRKAGTAGLKVTRSRKARCRCATIASEQPPQTKKEDDPMAKFYICRRCGNLAGMVRDSGVPIVCCGQKMEELVPNTVEASGEKHLPVVTVEDGALNVNIGSVDHPMVPEHFIESVYVETENG